MDFNLVDSHVEEIKTATLPNSNTAVKVGGTMEEMVDKIKEVEAERALISRRVISTEMTAEQARLLVPPNDRCGGYNISRIVSGAFVDEYYNKAYTNESDWWVKDSNWITLETQNNKNVANGYAGLDAAKKLANDIIRTDFRMSQGYIFDGIDDYLTVAHNDKLNFGTDDFSLEVFFKTKVAGVNNITNIITKNDATSFPYKGISVYLDNGAIIVRTTEKFYFVAYFLSQPVETIHLVITRSGNCWKSYVNGSFITTSTEINPNTMSTIEPLTIGGSKLMFDQNFILFRLFNRALSQSDVTYYENGGRSDLQRLKYEDVITNYVELLVNGNFETNYGWVLGSDWTINNGKLVGSNTSTESHGGEIYRLNLRGKRVRLSFMSNLTGGRIERVSIIGVSDFRGIDTTGTYVNEFLNKGTYADSLYILGKNFTGSIYNASVKQLGCVLELLPQNALPDRWLESQNGLDAITSGNPAINTETPVTDYSIVDNVTNNIAIGTANRDYTLPAGYIVDSVCVNSTVALTALQLVNVTNSEILLTGKTVSATANKHLPITADQSSSKVNTTIRLNCAGNTGLGFNIVINIKKCL